VKFSNPGHAKFNTLKASLEAVKVVANFVNEAQRECENAQKLLAIQESLVGKRAVPILEPQRKFFDEGDLTWYNSSRGEPREMHYVLCNDCLLLATPERGFFQSDTKLKLKLNAALSTVDIKEVVDLNDPDKKFSIETPRKTYLVNLDASIDRDEWIKVFYWLRTGTGPRFEKASKEAERREMTRTASLAKMRPKKEEKPVGKRQVALTLPRNLTSPTTNNTNNTNNTTTSNNNNQTKVNVPTTSERNPVKHATTAPLPNTTTTTTTPPTPELKLRSISQFFAPKHTPPGTPK